MLRVFLMPPLRLTLLLLLCKIGDMKDLNFMDFEGTQYSVLPEKSLDYPAAKRICADNNAHLVQFTTLRKLVYFLIAYEDSQILKMKTIKFWISAIKLKGNPPTWKVDDGSGQEIERFDSKIQAHWVDEDETGLEPKDCLTYTYKARLFAADFCSNRNSVMCMRPLSIFGIETGIRFTDKLRNQYLFTTDRPLKYYEAKTRCLGLHAALMSFQSDLSLSVFVETLASETQVSKNTNFKIWLSAKRTDDKYETGDNIWVVDNGLGTVFPRLTNVKWVDSRGTTGKAADCLYFDTASEAFIAVDCGNPLSVICTKTPLVLLPYYVPPPSDKTTHTNVRVTPPRTPVTPVTPRSNETSLIDSCSGLSVATKVLSCFLVVMFVTSLTVSFLYINISRTSKTTDLCNKNKRKRPFSSSRTSKRPTGRSSATTDKVKSTKASIYYNLPGNGSIFEAKRRMTPSISKKPGLKCKTKIISPTDRSAKTTAPKSATLNYPYTDYEFVGTPAEQTKKNIKSMKT